MLIPSLSWGDGPVPKIVLTWASMCWLQISLVLSDVEDKVEGVEVCQPAA